MRRKERNADGTIRVNSGCLLYLTKSCRVSVSPVMTNNVVLCQCCAVPSREEANQKGSPRSVAAQSRHHTGPGKSIIAGIVSRLRLTKTERMLARESFTAVTRVQIPSGTPV